MIDYAPVLAWGKGEALNASCERGQAVAAMTKDLSALPLLTTDGMDMLYYQLAKIHAFATVQLAECARWC
jgi:hypothetical protein